MNNKKVERNFCIFYGLYSKKLRDLIPINGYLEFEKKMGNRRVDIFIEEEDYDVYIEMQTYDSDKKHLNQVLNIIENDELTDGKILWVATGFDVNHLKEVSMALNRSTKMLEFMAIEISTKMIKELEKFSGVDDFKIIDKLSFFNDKDDTKLLEKFSNESELKNRRFSFKRLANKEDELIRFYIKEIRKQIPNWVNAHNAKTLSARKINFGLGINDATMKFGLDRYNKLSVEIQFGNSQFTFFDELFVYKDMINKNLNPIPVWSLKKNKISHSILFDEKEKDEILKKQVVVLKKYLEVFYILVKFRDEIISIQSEKEMSKALTRMMT